MKEIMARSKLDVSIFLVISAFLSLVPALSMVVIPDHTWRERLEPRSKIDGLPLLHFELLPEIQKASDDIKPIAKVGIRPKPAFSESMDALIAQTFGVNIAASDSGDEASSSNRKVGVFVYMWVDPSYRGKHLGLELLRRARDRCLCIGCEYMLIVHDDRGSGKLIEYYERCGFVPIFDFLEKGMLCDLRSLRLDEPAS